MILSSLNQITAKLLFDVEDGNNLMLNKQARGSCKKIRCCPIFS